MKTAARLALLSLLVFTLRAEATGYTPPGKPALTSCRSPEKETFTCWWEPGLDGGLPTTYALYYRKENSDAVYECPDYRTAGQNSCFFNKNNTSIWVNYNITVVATNALGSTFSDPVEIDVVYIVQPNPPEKVSVTVLEDKGYPFLRVSWEPPCKADTRSGWITLIYEIRIKVDGENDWETHLAGQQKFFNIFSLRSGGTYQVQVRCKPDHGFWSEWSQASSIRFPDYFHREKSVWIVVSVFSAFIFLICMWLLHMNSHSLKHCLLPPVPGPKIKGFDKQLLKNGKSEEVFSALVVSDFPPTSSNYEDLLVEFLEVYIPEEQELMLEESKDLQDGCLKSESSASDSDSGRGSCDSHTLLLDKCGEACEGTRHTSRGGGQAEGQRRKKEWEEDRSARPREDAVGIDMPGGRVKTWPTVFSPVPQYSSQLLERQSSLEAAKQHWVSDSVYPQTSSYLTQPGHGGKEALGPGYWEFSLSSERPDQPPPASRQARQHLQAHSEVNIASIGVRPIHRANEYVEVQKVTEKNMVLLQPVAPGPQLSPGRDYSRVKRVGSDNMLLLQREVDVKGKVDACACEYRGGDRGTEDCYAPSTITANQKPMVCLPPKEERVLAASGYVDTATMFTMPTY